MSVATTRCEAPPSPIGVVFRTCPGPRVTMRDLRQAKSGGIPRGTGAPVGGSSQVTAPWSPSPTQPTIAPAEEARRLESQTPPSACIGRRLGSCVVDRWWKSRSHHVSHRHTQRAFAYLMLGAYAGRYVMAAFSLGQRQSWKRRASSHPHTPPSSLVSGANAAHAGCFV